MRIGRLLGFLAIVFTILCIYDKSLLDPTQPLKLFLLSIFCLVSNTILLFNRSRQKRINLRNPIIIVYVGYLSIGLLSLLYSTNTINGLVDWFKAFLFFNLLILGLFFFQSSKASILNYLSLFFALLQLLVFISTLIGVSNLDGPIPFFKEKLECGLFFNSNLGSQILYLSLPYSIYGIISSIWYKKWFFTLSTVMALTMIAIFLSKTVYMAIFIMMYAVLVMQLFTSSRYSFTKKLIISLLIPIGLFSAATVYTNSNSISDSFKIREEIWSRTMLLILDQPITGSGLGSWMVDNARYAPTPENASDEIKKFHIYSPNGLTNYLRPHNDFLWVWSETGLIGLLLYGALFILILRNLIFMYT